MNKYLTGSVTAEPTMNIATAEAVFNAEIKRAEDKMHLDNVSDMLDEVGHENIPTPALDLIMDTVSKEVLADSVQHSEEASEEATSESLILLFITGWITGTLINAIIRKITVVKTNKRIGELRNLITLVESRNLSKGVLAQAIAKKKGLVNLYSQGGSAKLIVNSFGKVEESLNEFGSSMGDEMDMTKLFASIDKVLFKDAIKVKSVGESILTVYTSEGIGVVSSRDLGYYFFISGEPKGDLVKDIIKDAKDNLIASAVESVMKDYEAALYQIDKASKKASDKFGEIVKERGDGFFKRLFGNRDEKKALKRRQQIMFELAYKNFIGSYAGYIEDVHGLMKELAK